MAASGGAVYTTGGEDRSACRQEQTIEQVKKRSRAAGQVTSKMTAFISATKPSSAPAAYSTARLIVIALMLANFGGQQETKGK